MALLVTDCPRCGSSSMTFDVVAELFTRVESTWVRLYEAFCVCRNCKRSTTFVLRLSDYDAQRIFEKEGSLVGYSDGLNRFFQIDGYINMLATAAVAPPEHVPRDIESAFREAAACLVVECFNAAGTMFRLCVDLATRPLLPDPQDTTITQPKEKQRRDLGLRLPWLFANNLLPRELAGLAGCIREDGNDGAHVGSLAKEDAEDLLDFTTALLERLYTEPKRLILAEERRAARRARY